MSATNAQVADLLRQYAAALTLEGADRFKTKAYRRAADTIESLDTDVAKLVAEGSDLRKLPGVGAAISQKIADIVRSGKLVQLERSISNLKPELVELATKPSLDPTKVLRIYKKLKINSLAELRERLEAGEIDDAFGPRIAYHVRQGLADRPRMLLYDAEPIAREIEAYLRGMPGVTNVSATGSLRRKKDTVGDLSFLISGKTAATIFKQVAQYGRVRSTEKLNSQETLFTLSSGATVRLAWTRPDAWGIALILQTGSEAHLEQLQTHAKKKRVSLTAKSFTAKRNGSADEQAVYDKLRLQYIEPELREGRGEIDAAARQELPALVGQEDLRGDLHMHTTASDGAHSMQQMVEAARQRGYEYIAISDHSQSLKITNGLTEKRLLAQIKKIDKLNERLKGFVVLKSAEVDILQDGKLDYSDAVLKHLDLTICSIHSRFSMNKEQQTERILRAIDNRYFNILGHATGRLLLKRQGYELDIERILDHAKANGCYVEINSSPDRLDLSDEHAKLAKDRGILVAVNTDAHSTAELDFISAGIHQARRAWLAPADVLNTLTWPKLKKVLRR